MERENEVFTINTTSSTPYLRFTREKHFCIVLWVVYSDILIDVFLNIGIYIPINLICDDLISPYNSKTHIVFKKKKNVIFIT